MNAYARRFIALVQIVGGFLGVAMTSSLAMAAELSLPWRFRLGLLGLPFFFSLYAGRALWRDEPRGYTLSILLHVPQAFLLSTTGLAYQFSVGAAVGAWFAGPWIEPMWSLGSHFSADWRGEPTRTAIGINFVALLFLVQLIRGWRAQRAGSVIERRAAPA